MSNETGLRKTDHEGCIGIVVILGTILLLLLVAVLSVMPPHFGDPLPPSPAAERIFPTVPPSGEVGFVVSFVKTQTCKDNPQIIAVYQITNTGTIAIQTPTAYVSYLNNAGLITGGQSLPFRTSPDVCTSSTQMLQLGPGAVGYVQTTLLFDARGYPVQGNFIAEGEGRVSQYTWQFFLQ